MTKLLISDVERLNEPAVYAKLYGEASPERRAKADSFRFAKDRNLSLGAAALLDIGLRPYGLREKEMTYGHTENGKPYFKNMPSLHFNVSHSASKVAVAFSDREVGCDIEQVKTFDPDVAEAFFSEREYAALTTVKDPSERNWRFYRQWALKESYMKVVGLGFSLSSKSFSIVENARGGFLVIPEEETELDTKFSFLTPEIGGGYACALCYRPESGIPYLSLNR